MGKKKDRLGASRAPEKHATGGTMENFGDGGRGKGLSKKEMGMIISVNLDRGNLPDKKGRHRSGEGPLAHLRNGRIINRISNRAFEGARHDVGLEQGRFEGPKAAWKKSAGQ